MARGKIVKHTVKGFTGNYSEIARHFNINLGTLKSIIKAGYSLEDAIDKAVSPAGGGRMPTVYEIGKFKGTRVQLCSRFGVGLGWKPSEFVDTIRNRSEVTFYKVGKYRGTLKAISVEFGVSYSDLRSVVAK